MTFEGQPLPGASTIPSAGLFAFESGRKLYYGDSAYDTLAAYSPLGFSYTEPVLPDATYDGPGIRRGWAVRGSRFVQLLSSWAYGSYTFALTAFDLPALPPFDATEAQGKWLSIEPYATLPSFRPLVLADGTRFVQTFPAQVGATNVAGHLWRSDGPDQPFTSATDVTWDLFQPSTPVYGAGGRLYALRADLRLLRSADRGATWAGWGSLTNVPQDFGAAAFFPDGHALLYFVGPFVTGGTAKLLYSADVESGRPFAERATLPDLSDPNGASLDLVGVYPDGNAAWALAHDGHFHPAHLDARHVAADGTVDAQQQVEMPGSAFPGAGARLGSGAVVFLDAPLHPSAPVLFAPKFVRWAPGDPATESVDPGWPADMERCQAPVALADGRVALVCTRAESAVSRHVVCSVTADGRAWSAPAVLRPGGSRAQLAYGAAAEPDGALFVVLTDELAPLVLRVPHP
jgi:hypothetical protein